MEELNFTRSGMRDRITGEFPPDESVMVVAAGNIKTGENRNAQEEATNTSRRDREPRTMRAFALHPACPVSPVGSFGDGRVMFLGVASVRARLSSDLESVRSEVEQQADVDPGRCEIVDELCFVLRRQRAYGFAFDKDATFDEDVSCKPADDNSFVVNLESDSRSRCSPRARSSRTSAFL